MSLLPSPGADFSRLSLSLVLFHSFYSSSTGVSLVKTRSLSLSVTAILVSLTDLSSPLLPFPPGTENYEWYDPASISTKDGALHITLTEMQIQ